MYMGKMNVEDLEKLSPSEWPTPEPVQPRPEFVKKVKKEFQAWIDLQTE